MLIKEKTKHAWKTVHDCDDENGEPACWAKEVNHPRYGRFIWISRCGENEYGVEELSGEETKTLVVCRSLASAKRWVAANIG